MTAKLASQPDWDGSSTLILEPGMAPGKDKYFDAEQLHEQTRLAIEVFEATHFSPGRWVHHPARRGSSSPATYPHAFNSVWCPPTPCKAIIFYDHSSGHGAYAMEALLASHANKGPDWKGSVAAMRDGFFRDAPTGEKRSQKMQFAEGDNLVCDITAPPGVDWHADPTAPAPAAPSAPAPAPSAAPPPTEAEMEAAFKLFKAGCLATLKKKNPGKTPTELHSLSRVKWDTQPRARQQVFVDRYRARATAGPAQTAEERVIKAGQLVPLVLVGKNKGLEYLLTERGLYPAAGLKGSCQSSKYHSASNDCCCVRLLSVQPDFASECSALQHLVEVRVQLAPELSTFRHLCLFLPKVPPPPRVPLLLPPQPHPPSSPPTCYGYG